jgi:signal transduction histidine kinase
MENTEQFPELPVPELAAVRQCLAELDLVPAIRQRLECALNQSQAQVLQRLEQAARHAQRFVRLGHIAAHMVHEIRNPLNAIFLHADVVEEEMRQPTVDSRMQIGESIADIRTEVTRLYAVMQDYLALARLSALDLTPEDLGTVLSDCALEMQAPAEARGITLHLQGLTRLGLVSLHKPTFRCAVQNLMQQALDAMPQGGTLTLRGRRTAAQITVAIRDTSCGIPEEQLDVLFEPFSTAGAEWTGLRLYVAREIVAAHQGTIDVQSAPGMGTTFTITLPLVAAATDQP